MRVRCTNEAVWVMGVVAIFLLLTFWEPLYALIRQPPKTVYTFVHNHPEDYFFHLHVMRQGYEGAWVVITRMTPEDFPARFATPFFLLLGKMAHILPLGMGELYTLARGVGAVVFMMVLYRLIQHVFTDLRTKIAALVLTLSGTFLPDVSNKGFDVPVLVRSIWTELDPLMRLTFVPHHLWSKVLMIVLFLLFLTKRSPVLICIATLAAGWISPVFLVTYMAIMTMWVTLELLVYKSADRMLIISYILSMVAAITVSGYHWWLSKSSFPWTTYGPPWENNWLYLFPWWMYLQQFGVLFPFATLGSIVGFRRSSAIRLLTVWALMGWVFIFILRPFLPFSNSRYLTGYQWVAVGLLASYTIVRMKRLWLVTSLVFLFILPSWFVSVRDVMKRIDAQVALTNPQYFLPDDIQKTLTYLGTLKTCTVAAPDWLSTMIPAYTSCRSVSGHRLMTYANDIKVYEMNEFLFWNVPLENKATRISQYGITHVITLDGITGIDIIPLLAPTPAFVSGGVKVYGVR